ncbi:MAG: hypothetical protein ACYC90_08500 [Candidatus Nanopelagicales bacterium]
MRITYPSSSASGEHRRPRNRGRTLALWAAAPVLFGASLTAATAAQAADHPSGPAPNTNANTNANTNTNANASSNDASSNPGSSGNPGNSGNGSINGVAGNGAQGHYAVTICHATRSAKNPYVVLTVDASSISRLMSAIGNGHGRHTGAVFDPAVNRSGDNWGDIIPPVTNPRAGAVAFPGLNVR